MFYLHFPVCKNILYSFKDDIKMIVLLIYNRSKLDPKPLIDNELANLFKFEISGHANYYCFNTQAKMSGATIVASDSTINLGVWISSLPQVIFSFGTAPE